MRAYKPDAIPAETMDYIKECTRLAPSAVNKQPWKFILFTGEDDRARMQQCYDKEWFREAPAYILVCENHGAAWTRRYDEKNHADIDVAIAIEHLCLGSSRTGIGHLLGVQLPRATLPRTFQTARRVVSGGHHPHRLSGHTGHP